MGKQRAAGFSLIELMVVVAIIGILASIALPSYLEHQRKARRTAGAACLTAMAQQMERYYTTQLTYSNAGTPAVPALTARCEPEVLTFYNFARPVLAAPAAARLRPQSGWRPRRDPGPRCLRYRHPTARC